ncbi:hypothetical protein L1987_47285 [Smallanthus sonchifolius]|uniref:Uncharacterized protein n=1 Tax=Smallanthus sonchifolius TaxID=185202 RepID=A0ACB9G343_9ASTR|nr:hypothetical protein L1987_47285 [Smallanthus sonchifolius]
MLVQYAVKVVLWEKEFSFLSLSSSVILWCCAGDSEILLDKESELPSPLTRKKLQAITAITAITIARVCSVLTALSKNRTNSLHGLGPRVVGILLGSRKGHVHFAFQKHPTSQPAFLIELQTPISGLAKEMASGLVRITLECDNKEEKMKKVGIPTRILEEPVWRTYCNGKKCGFAMKRERGDKEWKVLKAVEPISMGAGVLPAEKPGDEDREDDEGGSFRYYGLSNRFLKCPPTLDECEQVSPAMYYQAQKLISLCGWEPRLLPYVVDCKDVQNTNVTVYPSRTSEIVEANDGFSTGNEKYDHMSVVLECMLCGARVGLWAFHTTPRPAEFARLIGHAELNDKNEAASEMDKTNHHIQGTSDSENGEKASSIANCSATSLKRNVLNLTPEQNFHPTIYLPVVGRNLRTCFSSAFKPVNDDHHNSTSNGLVEATDQPKKVDGKVVEFDPIKHRHFCPWIASNGKLPPGWKQTLSALEHQKEFVYPSETTQASSSLIEVEDPVGFVKKLLTPTSAKRQKFELKKAHQ